MNKAFKIRLYPTKKQEDLIDKTIGCCRFLYNQMLDERTNFYKENKKDKSKLKNHKYKTESQYKVDFPFLKEVPSRALQQSRLNLLSAFTNFFKKRSKYPKFKKKNKNKWSYKEPQVGNQLRFENNKLHLPKLGFVKFKGLSNDFNGLIKSVTITKDRDLTYHASILVECPEVKLERKTNNNIGIDLGLKSFVTLSNGTQITLPDVKTLDKQIQKQQKHLSRKTKGSKRRAKCKVKLAKLHKKRTNTLTHFFRHLSNTICSENQTIKVENLNVEGMLKNRKLSRKIHSVAWSRFITMLKQTAVKYNSTVEEIDRFYPSSKLCSNCNHKKDTLLLSERVFKCEKCGFELDRDLNAAINIKQYKSDELSDNEHGETINLVKKFFNFNTSCFDEVFTKPMEVCNELT